MNQQISTKSIARIAAIQTLYQFASSQDRYRIDLNKAIGGWNVDCRMPSGDQLLDQVRRLDAVEIGVKNDQPLSFLFIRNTAYGNGHRLLVTTDKRGDILFDLDVRNHLTADLRESTFSTRDVNESVGIHMPDVA